MIYTAKTLMYSIIRIHCYAVIHYCMMIIINSNDNNTCDHLQIFQYIQNIFHTFGFHTLKADALFILPRSKKHHVALVSDFLFVISLGKNTSPESIYFLYCSWTPV